MNVQSLNDTYPLKVYISKLMKIKIITQDELDLANGDKTFVINLSKITYVLSSICFKIISSKNWECDYIGSRSNH